MQRPLVGSVHVFLDQDGRRGEWVEKTDEFTGYLQLISSYIQKSDGADLASRLPLIAGKLEIIPSFTPRSFGVKCFSPSSSPAQR